MKNTNRRYEAPQAEAIVIECQGVLCASGAGATSKNTGGGTTNMSTNDSFSW